VDYTLDRLLPIWQRTSEQDWHLCELNQQGVNSSRHVPGVYSEKKEVRALIIIIDLFIVLFLTNNYSLPVGWRGQVHAVVHQEDGGCLKQRGGNKMAYRSEDVDTV
jgi:hypothetical protein